MSEQTVSLKEYFESRLDEKDKRDQQRFESGENRLDSMNEFRSALNDAQKTYISRTEALAAISRNEADIKAVTDRVNTSSGHSTGIRDGWGWLVGVIGLGMYLWSILHK
jgi:hypothetical protein